MEIDPQKLDGAFVLRGTQMPVAAVFENFSDGIGGGELIKLHERRTRGDIQAVLEFAAHGRQVRASAERFDPGMEAHLPSPHNPTASS